jgi:hypothetical protein
VEICSRYSGRRKFAGAPANIYLWRPRSMSIVGTATVALPDVRLIRQKSFLTVSERGAKLFFIQSNGGWPGAVAASNRGATAHS